MIRSIRGLTCCLIPLALACSGSSGKDGGGSPDSGNGTDGGNCNTLTRSGAIGYVKIVGPTTTYEATAYFLATAVTETGCFGSCTFLPAQTFDGGMVDGGVRVAGGTVTFTDVTSGANAALMQAGGTYFTTAVTWSGGDSLQMAGTGGAFPAFSATMQAPADLAGVTPAIGSTPISVSVSSPFTLSWTPSSSGSVGVILGMSTPAGAILCTAFDSAGTITVPTSLLANFTAGAQVHGMTLQRNASAVDNSSGQTLSEGATTMVLGNFTLSP